jgi:hypothetical protein
MGSTSWDGGSLQLLHDDAHLCIQPVVCIQLPKNLCVCMCACVSACVGARAQV